MQRLCLIITLLVTVDVCSAQVEISEGGLVLNPKALESIVEGDSNKAPEQTRGLSQPEIQSYLASLFGPQENEDEESETPTSCEIDPALMVNANLAPGYDCKKFGDTESLRRVISQLKILESWFGVIETGGFPWSQRDGFASVDDFKQSILLFKQFRANAAQSAARSKESAAVLLEMADVVASLEFWLKDENWKLLTRSYRDAQWSSEIRDNDSEGTFASRRDVRWMLARLELLLNRCSGVRVSVSEETFCCRCTYSAFEQDICRAQAAGDCKSQGEAKCAVLDDSCNSINAIRCLRAQKEKSLMGYSCAETTVSRVSWARYDDFKISNAKRKECTTFVDVNDDHSYERFIADLFPGRISSAINAYPNLKKYLFIDTGCSGMTDGNCNLSVEHYKKQLEGLLVDAGLSELAVVVTGNQNKSITQFVVGESGSKKICMSPITLASQVDLVPKILTV